MKIVADENIPYVMQAMARLGTVRTLPGRALRREDLADADVLLVRSVTRVDETLLSGTPVRFVGTATVGTDHMDTDFLRSAGIGFASAAGSNANSVAEYVVAALLHLAERFDLRLEEMTLGVVGYGRIGSRVARYASGALGMRLLLNDPPLRRQIGRADLVTLDRVLAEADAISLHVPLTLCGPDPTYHLLAADQLGCFRRNGILVNTSRGAVVDGAALKAVLKAGHLRAAVLDVWENEPTIDAELLRLTALGTPHIAGYSLDGKVAGTRMLFDAVCNYFNIIDQWDPAPLMPRMDDPVVRLAPSGDDQNDLHRLVKAVYDIRQDDARLRCAAELPDSQRAVQFDRLRDEYPLRREFHSFDVRLDEQAPSLKGRIAALGFSVQV